MEKLDEMILTDLTIRALNTSKFVRMLRREKYFFEIMFLPSYFLNNFPGYSIDELNAACKRLEANKFIGYLSTAYLNLNKKGADYCSKEIDLQYLEMH